MPVFSQAVRDKIVLLRGLRNLGTAIEGPYELIKIEWPSPDGTKYYAVTAVDEIASVAPPVTVEDPRLIPDNTPNWFLPVEMDSAIGDEEIEMNFWDADDVISDLVLDHGEGLRVTSLFWFPQVALMLPVWEGHLRAEDEGDVEMLKVKAVQGFRSSEASIPSRGHYQFCQAVFGGVLTTQAEIDEHGCNYNKHLGGSVGTLDPVTGLPWTFCPRRSLGDCTARGVSPLRHLSHQTILTTTVNVQSSGARLLSTSIGNETNLSEPVRVIMGTRRIHDMKVMAYVRFNNTNNPDHGWFYAFYECVEGPIDAIYGVAVTINGVTKNDSGQLGFRLGNFGDASPDNTISTHGFSATAFIRYAYGWINPTAVDQEDASATAIISGLRDIRVYRTVGATENGLFATYFNDDTFTNEFGTQVITACNYLFSIFPPISGMPVTPQTGFSIRMTGKVNPRYTETYTFSLEHDNGVRLWVDSTLVIDQLASLGTHTGTIDLEADRPYDIQIDFIQEANPLANPWYCILRWQSATQALEVVPYERLFTGVAGELVIKQPTSNRAWHIARMLCDKRWGNGYDYDKLAIASWAESAAWVENYVRFTDPLGNIWDHQRGMSDVELIERKMQQQIEDMCLAGRLSLPYMFDGEIHISPLRALTEDELDECPEFTDEGDSARNIIQEEVEEGIWKSTLKWSRKSDLDLPNKIECTYDSAADDYKKTPLQPVEDIDAQLRAGRVLGDHSRKINPKKYHLLGVVGEAHGMKLSWALLDLGPHDEGGLANNLRLTFKIWFLDAIDLHMSKVIKVTSSRITKYGFTHFRILSMKRSDNLHYELGVQAYAHGYMATFETLLSDLAVRPKLPDAPRAPLPAAPQCVLQFGAIEYVDGILDIAIPECGGETAILDGGAFDTVFANVTDGGSFAQTFTSGYDGGGI